ncbi:MAG: signal peptidase I [Patescibacteria group bacterium]
MPKIFKIFYYLVIVLISVIALLLIISILPLTGNFKVLAVLSGSMEPTIKTGSVVAIKPAANYQIGDIITFGKIGKNQTPTTHRINDIRVQEGKPIYITKGDANNTPDQKEVLTNEVVGKVIFSVPYLGYAVDAAKKPIGFMIIIIVPAVIIIYDEARKIYAEIKKKKTKTIDKVD